jgi:malonyl-CoA O-methyltransferase
VSLRGFWQRISGSKRGAPAVPSRPAAALDPGLQREIRRTFDESSKDEEHFPSTIDPRILHVRSILKFFGPLADRRVLDAGCGKGRFARVLLEQNPKASVVGLDISEEMLACVPPGISAVAGTMTDLPFAASAFDALYATESLEHAVDIERAVGELCRTVKPGGKIVIIDKNIEHWGRFQTPSWERWFDRGEIERLLGRDCRKVQSEFLSYWEDVEPDGLFLIWYAEK